MWKLIFSRRDKIRTCDLCVPNAALYQAEPRAEFQLPNYIITYVRICLDIFLFYSRHSNKKESPTGDSFLKYLRFVLLSDQNHGRAARHLHLIPAIMRLFLRFEIIPILTICIGNDLPV